jgi:enoyl-CoA hydratase/carnithine racemase
VIAALNGIALGGGMELVLCCDIVIASTFAKLGMPEIKLGLVPGGGGTQRGVRKLGRNRASLLLMTGAIVPALEFVAAGLVNEVVEPDRLLPRALELARAIAAEPSTAIEGLKCLTAHALTGNLASGLSLEHEILGALYRSDIARERIRAFAEKSVQADGKAGRK